MRSALEALYRFISEWDFTNVNSAVFLRAEHHPELLKLLPNDSHLEQTFYPATRSLRSDRELIIENQLHSEIDLSLVLGTKNKLENLCNFARAYTFTKTDGNILFSLENQLGGDGFFKQLKKIIPEIQSEGLRRSRVVHLKKSDRLTESTLKEWLELEWTTVKEQPELIAHCSSFSATKVDPGSKLLLDSLPEPLSGRGADFGAGYGFLSYELLKKSTTIEAIYLIDTELYSLNAAKKNLQSFTNRVELNYLWHDLSETPQISNLDWIISNPPFHDTIKQQPELLNRFFDSALASLKIGGRFYFVAPTHLKISNRLPSKFGNYQRLAQHGMYEVVQVEKQR